MISAYRRGLVVVTAGMLLLAVTLAAPGFAQTRRPAGTRMAVAASATLAVPSASGAYGTATAPSDSGSVRVTVSDVGQVPGGGGDFDGIGTWGRFPATIGKRPVPQPPPAAPPVTDGSTGSWAGYLVSRSPFPDISQPVPASYTRVQATWKQPSAQCSARENSAAGFWVGLGGIRAPLEQVGTTAECVSGGIRYRAFYENISGDPSQDPGAVFLIPENGYEGYSVTPNDRIEASVEANGEGQFRFSINDSAWKQPFTTPWLPGSPDAAAVSSAEWIAEAPSGLDPQCRLSQCALTRVMTNAQTGEVFPGVMFSSCAVDGQAMSIGPSVTRLNLTYAAGTSVPTTSAISPDYTAFSIRWQSP